MNTDQPTYPPFSGDTPTCPKCGNEEASTRYLAHGTCSHGGGLDNAVVGVEPNERLHRECIRCDYAWDEALAPSTACEPQAGSLDSETA